MSLPDQTPVDNSPIHWWQSRILWSTLVSSISGLLALSGHTIDAGEQQQLVSALADVAGGIAVIASALTAYYRTKNTPPIKGTKVAALSTQASPAVPSQSLNITNLVPRE